MISGASEEELELANVIADKLLLQKENQQLKQINEEHKKLNGELMVENQELKKQLEEYKNSQSCSFVNICKSTKIANYNQQKEFIKWLENEIHTIETTYSQINGIYGLINETLEALKEVLRKYKEIIGE